MARLISRCLLLQRINRDQVHRSIRTREFDHLASGFVRVAVKFSSLNYKDALCASGHVGIARTLPLVPGIDAAGIVAESHDPLIRPGEQVLVFHASFGTECHGGFSEFVDVPAEWIYALPAGLTLKQAMILGTAGFTAAQCVDQLQRHRITPNSGDIVVTGATGGVGICAVKLLAQLGFRVSAVTGKPDQAVRLRQLGAQQVLARAEVEDPTDRPLLSGRWAGAIDTVGGQTLGTIIRATRNQGCVTACGLVGGSDIRLTVYPFILRGVTLQGIDSAGIDRGYRASIWKRLATDWSMEDLEDLAVEVHLDGLEAKIQAMLAGQITGRVLVICS